MRNYPKLTMAESLEKDHGWRIYPVDRMTNLLVPTTTCFSLFVLRGGKVRATTAQIYIYIYIYICACACACACAVGTGGFC